ncbi:MAG: condensation domain-containing protein [Rhodocyclaceae bacterium]
MADQIGNGSLRIPLAPRHQRYFDMQYALPHYFNTPSQIAVPPDLDFDAMKRAFRYVLRQHDALRLRFQRDGDAWQGFISPPDDDTQDEFESLDLSGVAPADRAAVMETAGARVQGSLDLHDGPVFKVVHLDFGPRMPGRLVIIAHHMLVDGFSLTVLLEDIKALYAQALAGQPFSLPPIPVSFRQWVERMHTLAQSDHMRHEYPYWQQLREHAPAPLPVDHRHGPNDEASLISVTRTLAVDDTIALTRHSLRKLKISIMDALLTALAVSLRAWTGQDRLWVETTHHGRDLLPDELDLTRTVGLLTANFPVVIDIDGLASLDDIVRRVRDIRDAVPNQGAGYGVLRYMTEDAVMAAGMRAVPRADVNFNYVGNVPADAPGHGPMERFGPHRHAAHPRANLLSCKAMIKGDQLIVGWESSANFHRPDTLARLADDYMQCIRDIARL